MKPRSVCFLLAFFLYSSVALPQPNVSSSDSKSVGGSCERCDLMFVDIPSKIESTSTLVKPDESGEKLEISGVIYGPDAETPVAGVIIYIYQTATSGRYEPDPKQTGDVRRHGRIRGWVKSNEKGEYKFITIRPGRYPNSSIAAHIHPIIKEPGKNAYHIDDFVFSDDPLVDQDYQSQQELRGGSGIVNVRKENDKWIGRRDIFLGLNIPNYPQ